MMRRIGSTLAVTALAVLAITPAATAATTPDDATGRSWEVAAARWDLIRSPGSIVMTGALAFLNVDDGSVRELPWGDYAPGDLAYAPDARTLYSVGSIGDLYDDYGLLFAAHEASSGDVLWTATVSGDRERLAVSPDGSIAMTPHDKIDLVTRQVVTFDPCGGTVADGPIHVAFSPDGSTAWIVCRFRDPDRAELRAFDPTTLDLLRTIELTHDVTGAIAMTPDGSTAVLSGAWVPGPVFNQRAVRVDLATSAVADIVTTDAYMSGSISTSPDGTRAYLSVQSPSDAQDYLWAVDLATMTVAASGPLENNGAHPIVTPDGARVFATGFGPWGEGGERVSAISVHDAATLTALDATPLLDAAERLAITPDQAPVARLTASEPHSPVTFDASTSTVEFGSIAEYAWDFGDGTTTVTTTPIVEHEYAEPGQYTATVRLTSSGGTSTDDVYTGQQLLRNGDPSAIASVVVTVPTAAPDGLPDELPPTGSDSTWLIAAAGGMLVAGTIALVIARRRVQDQGKDA